MFLVEKRVPNAFILHNMHGVGIVRTRHWARNAENLVNNGPIVGS